MRKAALCLLALALLPQSARGQPAVAADSIAIHHATSPITIDGKLDEDAWHTATRIEQWYETQPGDNIDPPVRNVGYLAYDDKFLYAAFEFDDPHPAALRAPFADRDDISGSGTDYGGILVDGRGTGATGAFFLVTPRNVQYDSIMDDASGENASPDFFWDSAARITDRGWTVEIRVPFSSIRYRQAAVQTWRIMLFRNYPRDFHYQFFSNRMPRDSNCFVCHAVMLTGLTGLPRGGHLVVAPYTTATDAAASTGVPGTPLGPRSTAAHAGVDVKYLPTADNAVDLTIKPDFSQVESDTAQIAANQRFALFYPERRPFFLEGADLFSTPIQAVYTRTITAPNAGARATGKEHGIRYTVLAAEDAGGGSAIVPGANGSSLAPDDFGSTVLVARAKRDVGLSFASVLVADRERLDGQGFNRVAGPDFQWRVSQKDSFSGQLLFSGTATPAHPELAAEWTGQSFGGRAAQLQWNHGTTHFDWFTQYRDYSKGFRADTGFVPQVGMYDANGYAGWTVHLQHFAVSRVRSSFTAGRQTDMTGRVIGTNVEPGISGDTIMSGFFNVSVPTSQVRTLADDLISRRQFAYYYQFTPSRFLPQIEVDGRLGEDIDFGNSRPAHGATFDAAATVRPTNHLELAAVWNDQSLDVDAGGARERLFTARVARLKSTYTFTSKLFARAIGQYVWTDRDPSLYIAAVDARSGDFSGSLLLAYKMNWQSVVYVGCGDDRSLTRSPADAGAPQPPNRLLPTDRQVFIKVSYAIQR